MEKEYNNKEQKKSTIKKLKNSKIDRVYRPLIADIMLRRKYEFELDDAIQERDINTFVKNVEAIEIGETPDGTLGVFSSLSKKIVLSRKLFENENIDFEHIYQVLAHECTHAVNFEDKGDRTFYNESINGKGVIEAFTECEADALVYNVQAINKDQIYTSRKTKGYSYITPYVDLMAATFGVERKELLTAAIKGKEEFENLLNNNINLTFSNSNKNMFFSWLSLNISLIHSAYKDKEKINYENIKEANKMIFTISELGIVKRLEEIKLENIDDFQEKFNKIKLDQRIIEDVIIKGYNCEGKKMLSKEEEKELIEGANGYYEQANTKLTYIEEVLKNDKVKDKLTLIQIIQKARTSELKDIMRSRGIFVYAWDKWTIPEDTIKEHNQEYSSNGMKWNNTEVIEYIDKHQPRANIIEKLKQRMGRLFRKNNTEALPAGKELKYWNLENWGTDKQEFEKKLENVVKEYLNKESDKQNKNIEFKENDK